MNQLDFTSALYLGLGHPSRALPTWSQLTTGTPAAIGESPIAHAVARATATLIGAEAGVVAASTLHLSFDLLALLTRGRAAIYADDSLYPITRWGIEHAAMHGARVRWFRAHDASALRRALDHDAPHGPPPVVVTDGLCPACGRVAPLPEYLDHARAFGGRLVIDDTQAIGVLGAGASAQNPFGYGGGGTTRHCGVAGSDIAVMASLAKGFGAPVAVLAASNALVRVFRQHAETRVHCSPPSVANLLAAGRALTMNARTGDALRWRLLRLVARFRAAIAHTRLLTSRWCFPVQSLRIPDGVSPSDAQRQLVNRGVRAVLTRGRNGRTAMTFVFNAAHEIRAIDYAAATVIDVLRPDVSTLSTRVNRLGLARVG